MFYLQLARKLSNEAQRIQIWKRVYSNEAFSFCFFASLLLATPILSNQKRASGDFFSFPVILF